MNHTIGTAFFSGSSTGGCHGANLADWGEFVKKKPSEEGPYVKLLEKNFYFKNFKKSESDESKNFESDFNEFL